MKAVLQWKDGRREPTTFGGGRTIIRCRHEPSLEAGGGYLETEFHIQDSDEPEADGTWVYLEGETKDVSDDMRRAAERNRQRSWNTMLRGLASNDCANKGCACPCHQGAHE